VRIVDSRGYLSNRNSDWAGHGCVVMVFQESDSFLDAGIGRQFTSVYKERKVATG